MEEKEILRLQNLASKKYKIKISKLEASALMAKKSQRGKMADKEVISFVKELRGVTSLDKELGGFFDG